MRQSIFLFPDHARGARLALNIPLLRHEDLISVDHRSKGPGIFASAVLRTRLDLRLHGHIVRPRRSILGIIEPEPVGLHP